MKGYVVHLIIMQNITQNDTHGGNLFQIFTVLVRIKGI